MMFDVPPIHTYDSLTRYVFDLAAAGSVRIMTVPYLLQVFLVAAFPFPWTAG